MAFEHIEAQCTGRYASLVRNGIGGHLDKPCANAADIQLYCNSADVDAWGVTATDLFNRVRRAWNDAMLAGTDIPQIVREYVTALEHDYCTADEHGVCQAYKLPEGNMWSITENTKSATLIARWCSRAACALELIDNARGIKGPIEKPQQNQPLGSGALGSVATVLAFGVGAYLLVNLLRR